MTSAFNLSQLANKVNTSGQVDATTGLNGIVPVANLGTGTPTSAKFLRGDGSWASSSSTFLAKELPLKSGTTLTAGRAVNINSSGEVGDYPVVNTLGTLVTSTTGEYEASSYGQSTDGSRTIKIVNNSNVWSVRGYAITDTTSTAGGLVSLGLSGAGANSGPWYSFETYPINETQILLACFTTSSTTYSAGTAYFNFRVVTVDSSGNVSLGTANSFSEANVGAWNGFYCFPRPLPSGRFVFYCLVHDAGGNPVQLSRTATISGTTITTTSDTDANNWFTGLQSYVTTNNKLIGASGASIYYCNYDGSTLSGTFSNTTVTTAPRASTSATSALISASYGIIIYQKGNNDVVLDTYSINQTTGVPTITSSHVIANSTFLMDVSSILLLTSTDVVVIYRLGAVTYLQSLKLNSTGNVIGSGIALVLDSSSNSIFGLKKSANNVVRFFYNALSYGNSRQVNINTYDTLSWVTVGATSTSQTTSPAEIVTGGVCSGFTGLSVGSKYYVNEATYDGQITTTLGSYFIGTAISSTEILLG